MLFKAARARWCVLVLFKDPDRLNIPTCLLGSGNNLDYTAIGKLYKNKSFFVSPNKVVKPGPDFRMPLLTCGYVTRTLLIML